MERVFTVDVQQHVGERIRIMGSLLSFRNMGSMGFLTIRDGWGTIQAVAQSELELAPLLSTNSGVESILSVEGHVVAEQQAPGGVELREISVEVLSSITEPPPVVLSKRDLKAHISTVLDNAVVTNRHPKRRAVLRIAAAIMKGYRVALMAERFTEIQSPKLVASATESGATVFAVKYFDTTAYLAQSPQFYKQIMVGVFERVFEVVPVFRAELHDTTRHINEYVSLDAEMGFIENHFTLMPILRKTIAVIMDTVQEECAAELTLLQVEIPHVPEEIPYIHFVDAQQLLCTEYGIDDRQEPDLSPAGERALGEWALKKYASDFLFVTGYPMVKRPFYTYADPVRPEYSNSFDLLFRGIEMTTGGQRLHLYEDYVQALAIKRLNAEPYEWYLEAFKYGMPPHGGWACGLERIATQITGLENIKLATLFPRDIHRLAP